MGDEEPETWIAIGPVAAGVYAVTTWRRNAPMNDNGARRRETNAAPLHDRHEGAKPVALTQSAGRGPEAEGK